MQISRVIFAFADFVHIWNHIKGNYVIAPDYSLFEHIVCWSRKFDIFIPTMFLFLCFLNTLFFNCKFKWKICLPKTHLNFTKLLKTEDNCPVFVNKRKTKY